MKTIKPGLQWDRVFIALICIVVLFVWMFLHFPVFTLILVYVIIGGLLHYWGAPK